MTSTLSISEWAERVAASVHVYLLQIKYSQNSAHMKKHSKATDRLYDIEAGIQVNFLH